MVVNVATVSQGVQSAESGRHCAAGLEQHTVSIVMIVYHHCARAVKDGDHITLQVGHIVVSSIIIGEVSRSALTVVEELQLFQGRYQGRHFGRLKISLSANAKNMRLSFESRTFYVLRDNMLKGKRIRACLGLCYSMGRWMGLSSGDRRTVPLSPKPSHCPPNYSPNHILSTFPSASRMAILQSSPRIVLLDSFPKEIIHIPSFSS